MARPKATVLPEPVCADTSMSRPSVPSTKTASCTAVRDSYPRAVKAAARGAAIFRFCIFFSKSGAVLPPDGTIFGTLALAGSRASLPIHCHRESCADARLIEQILPSVQSHRTPGFFGTDGRVQSAAVTGCKRRHGRVENGGVLSRLIDRDHVLRRALAVNFTRGAAPRLGQFGPRTS